ncbi:MAG: N-methyl-L-tryptophan oxidase [Gemmatimonadaceae bacterium]
MTAPYDAIIIGIGGMGSAAAAHLAGRGKRVLGLEQFSLAHDLGSSHGLTRIIRLAYFEHPSYVPLLRRSFELWRDLERDTNTTLLHVTGGLDIGPEGGRIFEGSLRSCLEHALPHEVLSGSAVGDHFPALVVPDGMRAVYQPDAGFLEPERCVQAHVARARSLGANIREYEPVIAWEPTERGVQVITSHGTYEGAQLVMTAGPWAGALVPELAQHLTPERQVLGWFEVTNHDIFAPAKLPVFWIESDVGAFYGFPEFAVPGLKLGRYHHLNERVVPDRIDRETHRRDEATLRACVERYFPLANGKLLSSKVCMFTNTVDEHFIVDRHPNHSQVLLVSPCSGHGFKFCSVIGEVVADLVDADRTSHDISLFRLSRLGSLGGSTLS